MRFFVAMIVMLTAGIAAEEFDKAVASYEKGGYIAALNTFYPLAKKGDAKAQYNVGLIYEKGRGVKADLSEAMRWYEKAAKQGNGKAQYNLARLYHAKGDQQEPHAYEKAKYWYEKAIENNIKEAYNNLATLYMEGKGTAVDEQKAFELFQKGAAMGDSAAQVNVAVMYAWNPHVTNDKMKAYENLKSALKKGQSEASGYLDKLCKESKWVCED
jgi:TPR repeat protein